MQRGRPRVCPHCHSSATARKGRRKTKTQGVRQIFRCKDCGRRFTPKNQKTNETIEATVPVLTPAPPREGAKLAKSPENAAAASELGPAIHYGASTEVTDHPRY